jgi:hypothetical protein
MHYLLVTSAVCANGSEVNLDFASLGWIQVIILGIVQGITELLPIRNSRKIFFSVGFTSSNSRRRFRTPHPLESRADS